MNWMGYAVSNHVAGDYDTAVSILDAFDKTQSSDRPVSYEESEMYLYWNQILSESGKIEEASKHLEEVKPRIFDKLSWEMKRGELDLLLGHFGQASSVYLELLRRGPDNYNVHRGLQCATLRLTHEECGKMLRLKACDLPSTALELTSEMRSLLVTVYEKLAVEYPQSLAMKRIPLTFLDGDAFLLSLRSYMHYMLEKGVPSLGPDLSSLFTVQKGGAQVFASNPLDLADHPVILAVHGLCSEFIVSLKTDNRFPGHSEEARPGALLWSMFLQSYILQKLGRLQEALDMAEQCITLDSSVIEMYQRKARVLKKMGSFNLAADVMNAAREMDLGDRYLNNKATKYLLRADRVEEAEKTVALFTRHEGDPQYNLFEMQCSWYELEWAESQMRQGCTSKALKKATAVVQHFQDYEDDQWDFHSYCMKRYTLRAYVDMLRLEDGIRGHNFFRRAAKLIILAYLKLHDSPIAEDKSGEPDYSAMNAAEKKKAKAKARKEAKKREEEQAKAAAAKAAASDNADATESGEHDEEGDGAKSIKRGRRGKPIPVDPDQDGLELAKKDPLPEAAHLAGILAAQAPKHVSTWILGYEVSMRRELWLMALQALFQAVRCSPVDVSVRSRIAQYFYRVQSLELAPIVNKTIADAGGDLLEGHAIPAYLKLLMSECRTLADRTEVAQAMNKIHGDASAAVKFLMEGLTGKDVTVDCCADALKVVGELAGEGPASEFKVRSCIQSAFNTAGPISDATPPPFVLTVCLPCSFSCGDRLWGYCSVDSVRTGNPSKYPLSERAGE